MEEEEQKHDQAQSAEALDLARRIVDILSDHKAIDIVLMDIRPAASFADYFVICNGTSDRQIQALATAVGDALEEVDSKPRQIEGKASSGWVLMDYGDVIVHIFSAENREFYKLERIWTTSPTVLRVQ